MSTGSTQPSPNPWRKTIKADELKAKVKPSKKKPNESKLALIARAAEDEQTEVTNGVKRKEDTHLLGEKTNEEEEEGEIESGTSQDDYCQANHTPFPPLSEINDVKYIARIQEIHAAVMNPDLDEECLNHILGIIQQTGNYSIDQHNLTLDWFNLDTHTISKIASLLHAQP